VLPGPRGTSLLAGSLAAPLLGMTLLPGCALFPPDADDLREEIVETALDQVGEDYRYGGADPSDGFDCSGLVFYSYARAGIRLPRSTREQRQAGRHVNFSEARPADLLFYNFGSLKPVQAGGKPPPPSLHVVLYLGDGKGVHAPVSDGEVEVIDVTAPHWRKRYLGARRIVREE
jgi:cell wall-associated NlpC family hydrolase